MTATPEVGGRGRRDRDLEKANITTNRKKSAKLTPDFVFVSDPFILVDGPQVQIGTRQSVLSIFSIHLHYHTQAGSDILVMPLCHLQGRR